MSKSRNSSCTLISLSISKTVVTIFNQWLTIVKQAQKLGKGCSEDKDRTDQCSGCLHSPFIVPPMTRFNVTLFKYLFCVYPCSASRACLGIHFPKVWMRIGNVKLWTVFSCHLFLWLTNVVFHIYEFREIYFPCLRDIQKPFCIN